MLRCAVPCRKDPPQRTPRGPQDVPNELKEGSNTFQMSSNNSRKQDTPRYVQDTLKIRPRYASPEAQRYARYLRHPSQTALPDTLNTRRPRYAQIRFQIRLQIPIVFHRAAGTIEAKSRRRSAWQQGRLPALPPRPWRANGQAHHCEWDRVVKNVPGDGQRDTPHETFHETPHETFHETPHETFHETPHEGPPGAFWGPLGFPGLSWDLLDSPGASWSRLGPPGIPWNLELRQRS